MTNDIEYTLVRRAIKGDIDSFEKIVYLYEKKIYNIAYSMFKNEQDSYDLSQEVFIKLYKNLNTFKFDSSFGTWIHKIAVNTCIDEYRKRKRNNNQVYSLDAPIDLESDTIERQIEDKSMTPEEQVLQNEYIKDIRKAIYLLKEDHKIIIILRDLQGLSYEEISNVLNCSVGTVKSRLSRARDALKRILYTKMEQKN